MVVTCFFANNIFLLPSSIYESGTKGSTTLKPSVIVALFLGLSCFIKWKELNTPCKEVEENKTRGWQWQVLSTKEEMDLAKLNDENEQMKGVWFEEN